MDISSKLVSTRVHTAVATVGDLKGVAIAAMVRQLGLGADTIVSSSAEVDADGSIAVEVVEAVAAAPAPEAKLAATQTQPAPTI